MRSIGCLRRIRFVQKRCYSKLEQHLFENFKDHHFCQFKGGDGGKGAVYFSRDAQNAYMGPTGGNGGRGGNIWLRASAKLSSLTHLKEIYAAQDGKNGGAEHRYGRNGKDLEIKVPVGTLVKNSQGSVLIDLVKSGDGFLIVSGGAGGYGNKEFANVDNPTPRTALPGEQGEIVNAEIELRSIADFGLVGLPNAGKSSLTMTITNTDLEVSDIPGTTLIPHLGHITYRDKVSCSIADLPGIEPDQPRAPRFLQHCARCVSLIYLIDGDDFHEQHVVEQFYTIRKHLADYDATINAEVRELELAKSKFYDRYDQDFERNDERYSSLADKPFIVCISKADQPGREYRAKMLNDELSNFRDSSLYFPKAIETSAKDLTGWSALQFLLRKMKEELSGNITDSLYWS